MAEERTKLSGESSRVSFSDLVRKFLPRWKECTLLFFVLTAITVFVPKNIGWVIFVTATILIALRGYRDPNTSLWGDLIRLGLIGFFVATLLFSIIASPLQRQAIIEISRYTYIAKPNLFLCCLWDGRQRRSPSRPRAD